MNADLLLVLGALIACVGLFIINKPRMDVVALLVIVILPLTGIISMPEALAGFSDTNVVLIAALFVIGEGLTRTGVAYRLGDHLIRMSGNSERNIAASRLRLTNPGPAALACTIPGVCRRCSTMAAASFAGG